MDKAEVTSIEIGKPSALTAAMEVIRKSLFDIDLSSFGSAKLGTKAVKPPYDIQFLVWLVHHSWALRVAIDAYSVNIDSFGHEFVPVLDLKRDDIKDIIAAAIQSETGKRTKPTSAVIARRLLQIEAEAIAEKQYLDSWFDFCCTEESFETLRRKTRMDYEATGNAYWEVGRDESGQPVMLTHLPVTTMLAGQLSAPIEVDFPVRISPISIEVQRRKRRFRTYIQTSGTSTVYFKQFGDPRIMSAASGEVYSTLPAMRKAEKDAEPATEIIHFKLYSPGAAAYGVPRWIANIMEVCGSREASEVNYMYFRNKSVPPLAVLVSGGAVTEETVDRLKDTFENDLHGVRNFHRVLILQAAGAGGSAGASNVKIDLKPLTSAQLGEGQFMKYMESNASALAASFRLPPLYTGRVEKFNRATAQVARDITEEQVFQPERMEFDFAINRILLPEMGIRHWTFRTRGPTTSDMETKATALERFGKLGAPTLNELRTFMGEVFGREIEPIREEWADLPLTLAIESQRSKLTQKTAGANGNTQSEGSENGRQDQNGQGNGNAGSQGTGNAGQGSQGQPSPNPGGSGRGRASGNGAAGTPGSQSAGD